MTIFPILVQSLIFLNKHKFPHWVISWLPVFNSKRVNITYINKKIRKIFKHRFPEAFTVNKFTKTTLCYSCKNYSYVRQQSNDIFLFPPRQLTYLLCIYFLQTSTWCGTYWRENKSNELVNYFFKVMNYYHNNMNMIKMVLPKRKMSLLENKITFPIIMVETLNVYYRRDKVTPPNIISPDMIEER